MNATEWIHPLITYNTWANFQLMHWLNALDEKQFEKELTSSFSSIKQTALHIWNAERYWFSFLKGEPPEAFLKDHSGNISTFFTDWKAETLQLEHYLLSLSDEDLLKNLHVNTPWLKGEMPCYAFIQHVINHGTYHRGQIITLGRIVGLTQAPNTDFAIYTLAHLNNHLPANS